MSNPERLLGVREKTAEFLLDAIKSNAHQNLQVRRRNLIGIYFSTEASLVDLTEIASVKSRQRVRELIRTGLEQLWQNLPPHLQRKYPLEEITKLKSGRSPRTRRKLSKAMEKAWKNSTKMRQANKRLWGNPDFRKKMDKTGKKYSSETRAKMSQAHKKLWQDPEYRAKVIKALRRKPV